MNADTQPKPVRAAFLIFSAVLTILLGAIPVLQILGVVTLTGDQIAQIQLFATLVTVTVGQTISSIYAENRVTPVSSPRDNALVPMVAVEVDPEDNPYDE